MSKTQGLEEIVKKNMALETQNKKLKQLKTGFRSPAEDMSLASREKRTREEILDRHESFFSLTDDLIAYVDKNYIYQFINKEYCPEHNKKRAEIIGHSVAEILGEKLFQQAIKPRMDRCLSGETVTFHDWFEFASMGRRYMFSTYHPYQLSDGRIDGIIVVIHDLTDLKLAEEQQIFEKNRIDNIFQAMPDGVYIVNCQYKIEYVNPVIEKEFGPVNGMKCYNYLYNRKTPCKDCTNKSVFAGASLRRELDLPHNNKIYEIFESPLKSAGNIPAKITFFHDVTLKKQIKERLARKQLLLDGIINNSSTMISVKDASGKYLMANVSYYKLFNLTEQEVIGRTDYDMFPMEQAKKMQENDQQVLASRMICRFEEIVRQQDRDHVYFSVKFPLYDTYDKLYAVAGISTDITERKKLEHNLKENNEKLMAFINATPDAVCFKDGNGRWEIANDTILQLFELKEIDYKGKTDLELARQSKSCGDAFLNCADSDEETWKRAIPCRGEEIIQKADGEELIFDVIKVPLFHADGTRKGLVVRGHDITDHIKTAEKLHKESTLHQQAAAIIQKKSSDLKEANIALRILLKQQNNIAEELRQNVVTQLKKAVLPYITLLRQNKQDEKEIKIFDIIESHIFNIGTSFVKKLSNPELNLSPKEILVADLIRQGKSTKEIARLLSLKTSSVEAYRNKIRKKLGINKKKISLYQYLLGTFTSEI